MANYTKRDERQASIAERMAGERSRSELDDQRCACGAPSTMSLSEWKGTTFYCDRNCNSSTQCAAFKYL